MQRLAHLGQGEGDELDLDGALAVDVLVERRRLDVQLGGHRLHGQALGPVALEHVPCGGHDLVGPGHAPGPVSSAPVSVVGLGAGGGPGAGDVVGGLGHGGLGVGGLGVGGGLEDEDGVAGAMAASSSSVESAEVPSKNTPTSAFQRRR